MALNSITQQASAGPPVSDDGVPVARKFPLGFPEMIRKHHNAETHQHITKALNALLSDEPTLRPSAADLLTSPLLPPLAFDVHMERIFNSAVQPLSKESMHLMSTLFRRTETAGKDYA